MLSNQILRRAANGNKSAMQSVYEAYKEQVWFYCRWMTADENAGRRMYGKVWEILWRELSDRTPDSKSFDVAVLTTTVRSCRKQALSIDNRTFKEDIRAMFPSNRDENHKNNGKYSVLEVFANLPDRVRDFLLLSTVLESDTESMKLLQLNEEEGSFSEHAKEVFIRRAKEQMEVPADLRVLQDALKYEQNNGRIPDAGEVLKNAFVKYGKEKNKKRGRIIAITIAALVFVVGICIGLTHVFKTPEIKEYKDFSYYLRGNGEIRLVSYNNSDAEEVVIPAEIDGAKVTVLGSGLFSNHDEIVYMTIPKTIARIQEGAFLNCISLQYIKYEGTIEDWGKIKISAYNDVLFAPYSLLFSDGKAVGTGVN